MGLENSINQASLDGALNVNNGRTINAAFTGAVDTAVLRFDATAVAFGSRLGVTTTVDNGTIVTIGAPGVYKVDLSVTATGAVATACGIGIDMAVEPIVADPAIGTDGVIKATDDLGVVNLTQLIELSTVIYVSAVQAAAVVRVRFLCTDSEGGAPAGLVLAFGSFRVRQLAQVSF